MPPSGGPVSSAHGVIEPLAGWWSERLESVVPSWLVSFDAEAIGALELVTLVTPFEHEPPSGVALEATRIESGTQIRIRGMGAPGTIEVDLRTQPVRVSM